jgi:hypothetical protein
MPRKKKDNKDNKEEINQVKKKIEEVASDYRKYLVQMGAVSKDQKISQDFMENKKKKDDDKLVFEAPLMDMEEGPLGAMVDSLPTKELKNKFFETIDGYGLRINLNNGTVELLIYD